MTAKFGTKVGSIILGMAFALVFVVGCNTEEPAPSSGPAPVPGKGAPGAAGPQAAPIGKETPKPGPAAAPGGGTAKEGTAK